MPENAPAAARMGPAMAGSMLVFGLFVMVRRQLLGIRDRAEGRALGTPRFAGFAPATTATPGPAPA